MSQFVPESSDGPHWSRHDKAQAEPKPGQTPQRRGSKRINATIIAGESSTLMDKSCPQSPSQGKRNRVSSAFELTCQHAWEHLHSRPHITDSINLTLYDITFTSSGLFPSRACGWTCDGKEAKPKFALRGHSTNTGIAKLLLTHLTGEIITEQLQGDAAGHCLLQKGANGLVVVDSLSCDTSQKQADQKHELR